MMNDDTSTPPETDHAAAPETAPPHVDQPPADEQAAQLAAELAELKDRLLRQIAETENMRRRLEREKQDAGAYAISGFARELLGVADNLRRALAAVPESARGDAGVNTVIVGVEMTEKELLGAFGKAGISKIEALGQKLDPNKHQAVAEVPTADAEAGTIVQLLQDGYVIKDRLLRPAMVAVAKAADGAAPAPASPGSSVDTSA